MIASTGSPLQEISFPDMRKLYLGLPIQQDGLELVPIRNSTDPLLKEMFLQKVLYMSAAQYERMMVSRIYRNGGARIPEHTNAQQLMQALQSDQRKVTFMLDDAAATTAGVKLIGPSNTDGGR